MKNREENNIKKGQRFLVIFLFILGAAIIAYPFIDKIITSRKNVLEIQKFEEHQEEPREELKEYNKDVDSVFDTKTGSSRSDALITGEILGIIYIPRIEEKLPIRYGTTNNVLRDGVGILENTHLPFGGIGKHTVLTGHRGTASHTLFKHLDKLQKGDSVYIRIQGEILKYQVTSGVVVEANDRSLLKINNEKDLLTLITCHPYLINNQRLIYTLERSPLTNSDEEVTKTLTEDKEVIQKSIEKDKEREINKEITYVEETEKAPIIEDTSVTSAFKENVIFIILPFIFVLFFVMFFIYRRMKKK